MTPLYFKFPEWINPEIIKDFPVRWYGLMYVFAFGTAWFILSRLLKEGALNSRPGDKIKKNPTEDNLYNFISCGILFLLLGARIGYAVFYKPEMMTTPWTLFWPMEDGKFVGLQGMSFHGGFIGGLLGLIIYCLVRQRPILRWVDAMSTAIPLGYTFGRLGNFMNGELYGRITSSPLGMLFDPAKHGSGLNVAITDENRATLQQIADEVGIKIAEGQHYVNLPRFPSQLYEALFEGIVLFLILWFLRKKKPFDGFQTAIFTAGYGTFRFFIEYLRAPDVDQGYILGNKDAGVYVFESFLNISKGQILCFAMILAGVAIFITGYFLNKKKPGASDAQPSTKPKKD